MARHDIFFRKKEDFPKQEKPEIQEIQQTVGEQTGVVVKIYDDIYKADLKIEIIGGKLHCDGIPKANLQGTICVECIIGKKKNGVPGLTFVSN